MEQKRDKPLSVVKQCSQEPLEIIDNRNITVVEVIVNTQSKEAKIISAYSNSLK